jgi:hypothetical protein
MTEDINTNPKTRPPIAPDLDLLHAAVRSLRD